MVKYNAKIMLSNKYFLCIVFFIVIPFAMEFKNEKLAIAIFELYVSIIGIICFTDILLIENNLKIEEVAYLTKSNGLKKILIRIILNIIFIGIFPIITYGIVNLKLFINGNSLNISYVKVFIIFLPTTIFLGLLSMTLANLFRNSIIGYITGLIYWAYWLVNQKNHFILNIFSYTVNIENYMKSKILFLFLSVILIIINFYLVKRSPFKKVIKINI
ncbi:MAG: hypothetical protein ABF289_16795 [Clostridiales bacterium]